MAIHRTPVEFTAKAFITFAHTRITLMRAAPGLAVRSAKAPSIRAGKEVMIKAVLLAIPTFSMSCFQLSKGSCQKIISLIAKFWWGGSLEIGRAHV